MTKNGYKTKSSSPLPFTTPQPAPRPSFSERLFRSTYLFPKTLSSPGMKTDKCNTAAIIDNGSSNKKHDSTAAYPESIHSDPSIAGEFGPKKKSVRFYDKVKVYRRAGPRASDMSSNEKQKRWYNNNDFDHFKYEAASHAGVRIVPCDASNVISIQNRHFLMVGTFDETNISNNERDNISSSISSKSHPNKLYYNENEYNDSHNEDGEIVCRRGLGYHFSRNRRKSKVVTRSAVIAWQRKLRNPNNEANLKLKENLPTVSAKLIQLEKNQLELAIISRRFSRIASREAEWRGDVDYRVVYPERHNPTSVVTASSSFQNVNGDRYLTKTEGVSSTKKRKLSHDAKKSHLDIPSCKRR